MFKKSLYLRNYKQSKFLIWAFWVVSLFIPFEIYSEIKQVEYRMAHWSEWGNEGKFEYVFYGFNEGIFVIQMVILVLTASVLIGLERTNQSLDFTLSLPYRRSDISLAKWFIGAIHIVLAVTISSVISIIMINTSILETYVTNQVFFYYYVQALVVLLAVFTFSLFIGFIAGSVVSQFVLSWIFMYLPVGGFTLLFEFFSYHWRVFENYHVMFNQNIRTFFEKLSFPLQLLYIEREINKFNYHDFSGLVYMIIPVLVIIISLYLISNMSKDMKSENNGKLLLIPQLEPILKIGVIIFFFLFGGMVVGGMVYSYDETPKLLTFYVGGLFSASIAYFVLSKLIGIRLLFGRKVE